MKRIKAIIASIISVFALIILASCGGKSSGINAKEVDMEISSITKDSATIKLTFTENDNLKNGTAKPYVMAYKYVDNEETSGVKQNVSFNGDVYTSATVEFKSLANEQEYHFVLFVTFNGSDKKIKTVSGKTSNNVSREIDSASSFEENLVNDLDGDFVLTGDIDFKKADSEELDTVNLFSSESKAFQGTLDGNNHTIKNFKLGSATNAGLFGYLKGATIKNLVIENVVVSYTSKASSHIGALAGYVIDSNIENVTIKNVTYEVTTQSTAEINVGGVAGYSERTSYKNVYAEDVNINFTSAKHKVNAGLFIGRANGDALINDVLAQSCGAKGIINIATDCPTGSDAGAFYIGGFVGALNSSGKIDDSYAVVEETVSTKRQTSKDFDVFVGGFVGGNGPQGSSMYITNSLAISNINVYGGQLEDAPEFDYTQYNEDFFVATKNTYIGGFIGKASKVFRGIDNSYAKLADDFTIYADRTRTNKDDAEVIDTVLFEGAFIGKFDDASEMYIDSDGKALSPVDTTIPDTLSEALKELLQAE